MRAPLAVAALALVLAGCGSPELWERWRAERDFWRARRELERIQVNPRLATEADRERAEAKFRVVAQRYPADVWATPERLRDRRARDVAAIAADAWLAIGRLEESRGRRAEALDIFRRVSRDFRAMPLSDLKALVALAGAHERAGDAPAAAEVRAEIARRFLPVDAESGRPIRPALDAPLLVAAEWARQGRRAEAESVLRAAEGRFAAEARVRRGQPAAPELWIRVARMRGAARGPGRLASSLDALRQALAEPAAADMRPALVLTMAEFCLQGGQPDSALVYAAWAREDFEGRTRQDAMLIEARIWEQVSTDSALAVYQRFVEAFPRAGEPLLAARFRRAELLEQTGRWEEARNDFRSLATVSPTHPISLQAHEQIVAHHLRRKEKELAEIEAARALETLDHVSGSVRDEETLLRLQHAKARLLLAIGRYPEAFAALVELWSRYGSAALGVSAGFRAAELAERNLKDPERARKLYQELLARSPSTADQRAARSALERLGRDPG